MKLGYKASAEQFDPRTLLEYGVLAETLGFDSVFISDHLQPWRHTGGHAPFAFAWLGALAERTDRVLVGTSVLTPTFRYHPAQVAQGFATLGCLAPGRVVLGVGTGEALNEVALGTPWPDSQERFARLKEALELINLLWSEERVTFHGQYYATELATIYDRPDQVVPIYVAASGLRRRGWRAASQRASSAPAARIRRCTATRCCRRCMMAPRRRDATSAASSS